MKYLVTGGCGFIGSHVVDKLLEKGHKVVIIDDLSFGKNENLRQDPNIIIHNKSICDDLRGIFKNEKIDAVLHLAAIARVQQSIHNPEQTHKVNVDGTFNLLNACREFNVKRFVFASSSSVYGDQKQLPASEDCLPNPVSPYAVSKLIGEEYCNVFHKVYGLEAISLRFFNVYGERQNPAGAYASLIPTFSKLMKENKIPTINGSGSQTRDFTYVKDVADAVILSAETTNKECFGQAFNVGSGKNHSVNEVAEALIKLSGKDISPVHGPEVIEPKNTLADIRKAKQFLNWEPKTDFGEGLKNAFNLL